MKISHGLRVDVGAPLLIAGLFGAQRTANVREIQYVCADDCCSPVELIGYDAQDLSWVFQKDSAFGPA